MKYFIFAMLAALALAPAAAAAATPPGTCSVAYGPQAIPGDAIHSAVVTNMDIAPGRTANWHVHPGPEYLSVVSGSGWLEVEGERKINLRPGRAYEIAPNVSHRAHNGSKTTDLKWTGFIVLNTGGHTHTVLTKGSGPWTPGCAQRI
jgi:quercetin dioxygenase-like cupin family protein